MKNYRLYETMDFVQDDDFIRWVYKKNPHDNMYWDEWLKQNPDKLLTVTEARSMLEKMEIKLLTPPQEEIEAEVSKLLYTIADEKKMQVHKMPVRRWWLVAACAVLLAGISFLVFYLGARNNVSEAYSYADQVSAKRLVEQVNTSGRPLHVVLPDSSMVNLSPNSRISYANGFNDSATRDVYLSGEAFFEVTKNPQKPFRVFANEIITKVLGTSFTVRCFDNDKTIQVKVRTGKVNVYSQAAVKNKNELINNKQRGGVVLTPNQQVTYLKKERTFEKELLEKPQIVAEEIKPQLMVFEDAHVSSVLELLKAAYGINIIYDTDLLKECTITADLTDESLYKKLDLICKAIGAKYEVVNSEILIETTGCK